MESIDSAVVKQNKLELTSLLTLLFLSSAILSGELWIMRVFSVGSWTHFGSLVLSFAMLGFGLSSALLCLIQRFLEKRIHFWIEVFLFLWSPTLILANILAQKLPFNPILLNSDPAQKLYLAEFFLLYLVPFLCGGLALGLLLKLYQKQFATAYGWDLAGSSLGSLGLLASMFFISPPYLFIFSLACSFLSGITWILTRAKNDSKTSSSLPLWILMGSACVALGFSQTQINLCPYKGESYAKRFPDSKLIYEDSSPEGWLKIYQSSYLHFAPGLSDNAAFELSEMPKNAYLGMYIDGDGPMGILKALPPEETEYLKYLPVALPYSLLQKPEVLILQFGGGISTQTALKMGATHVTITEGNHSLEKALRTSDFLKQFTGNLLENSQLTWVSEEGRLWIQNNLKRYDLVEISFADSTGISNAAGTSITEKYLYTFENLQAAMQMLKPNGILSLSVWNKEDPPKSTLKLLASLFKAAESSKGNPNISSRFFITHTYLSTLSVFYKAEGFSSDEIKNLTDSCQKKSFEVLHPGIEAAGSAADLLQAYQGLYYSPITDETETHAGAAVKEEKPILSMSNFYRHYLKALFAKDSSFTKQFIFDTSPLSIEKPYFSGYIRLQDLWHFLTHPQLIQDEWGYLLLWFGLGASAFFALFLILLPLPKLKSFWKEPRKISIFIYFMGLGLGYMLIELGMIGRALYVLPYPSVTVSVLISGMLLFSGLGSLFSSRWNRTALQKIKIACCGIFIFLMLQYLAIAKASYFLSQLPELLRVFIVLVIIAPLAFLMGFPFSLGMSWLSEEKKDHLFIWVWGINGCFSVIGSMLAPLLLVHLGFKVLFVICGFIYLAVWGAFNRFSKIQKSPLLG